MTEAITAPKYTPVDGIQARVLCEYGDYYYGKFYHGVNGNNDITLRKQLKDGYSELVSGAYVVDGMVDVFNTNTLKDWGGSVFSSNAIIKSINQHSDGSWLMAVQDTSDARNYLYRSIDQGQNWGQNADADDLMPSLRLGYNATTDEHLTGVGLLIDRGITELDGVLILADYNVAALLPTANKTYSVLWHSTDFGRTWIKSFEQGTNGVDNWRHFHNITCDPLSGHVYIGFGDGTADSGIIVWQPRLSGSYVWPADNVGLSTIATWTGFDGVGSDRTLDGVPRKIYNATDFIVIPNSEWVIHVTDGNNVIEDGHLPNGIYRFKRNDPLNTFENVLNFETEGYTGVMEGAEVVQAGTNYSIGDVVSFTAGSYEGYGASAKVAAIDSNGGIVRVDIITKGQQYYGTTIAASVASSGGSGAVLEATVAMKLCAYGVRHKDGTLAIVEFKSNGNTSKDLGIYTSSGEGASGSWKRTGLIVQESDTIGAGVDSFFVNSDDELVVAHYNSIGRLSVGWSTTICKVDGFHYDQKLPHVLEPCIFVSAAPNTPSSNPSYRGFSKHLPITPDYALMNAFYGGRIQGIDDYPATRGGITPDLNRGSSTPRAQSHHHSCQVHGVTFIGTTTGSGYTATDQNNYLINFLDNDANPSHSLQRPNALSFHNCSLSLPTSVRTNKRIFWGKTGKEPIKLYDCQLGGRDNYLSSAGTYDHNSIPYDRVLGGNTDQANYELHRCKVINATSSATKSGMKCSGVKAYATDFDGGGYHYITDEAVNTDEFSGIEMENCTVHNAAGTVYGLIRYERSAEELTLKNNVLSGANASYVIYNTAGSLAAADCSNNVTDVSTLSQQPLPSTFINASVSAGTDLKINFDGQPISTSPYNGLVGSVRSVTVDNNLAAYKSTPSLGAFQYDESPISPATVYVGSGGSGGGGSDAGMTRSMIK